jgi:cholesterol oxidase
LAGGAATAAGLAIASLPTGRARADDEPVDVLIVGSGYSGAVAALRLAEAGIASVVLERGRRWPINPAGNTFATPAAPDGRASWLNATSPLTPVPLEVYTGVLEAVSAGGVTALAGAGVGGGSLVNNAVMLQPSRALFEQAFGTAVDYGEMADVWYQRARGLIGPAPMPDDVYASSYYTNARSFFYETSRAGLNPFRVDMAVDWSIVRGEIAGTVPPGFIAAQSIFGTNSGAKLSVDRTILARAESTGRVAVETLTRVVDIGVSGGRYKVSCERIDEHGTVLSRPVYTARHVFLAAGSLGTSRLLVRAKARGGLPALNEHVGRYWGTNGDHRTVRAGMPWNNPRQGGPSGIVAQDLSDPKNPVTMINFPWPRPPADGTGALGALAMGIVPPMGEFAYEAASDSVRLSWPPATDSRLKPINSAVEATINRVNAANPGTSTLLIDAESTSHALGGAVIGLACQPDGRVRGYDNLYVIDSSLIPGSTLSVPPALTVTALADRCVSKLIERIA